MVTEEVTNRRYLWIIPVIALTVCFVWITGNKFKKRQPDAASKNKVESTNNKPLKQENENQPVELIQTSIPSPKIKIDFVKELSSLQIISDNYTFFMQVKFLLTKALQVKENVETNTETILISSLQQTNNTAVINDAQNIYNTCNQCLYSPIISDDVRTTVHYQLASVIERLELLS